MNTAGALPDFDEVIAPRPGRILLRRGLGHRGLVIGGAVFVTIVILALAAPWLAVHDPYLQDLAVRLTPPVWHALGSWEHPLGTDSPGSRLPRAAALRRAHLVAHRPDHRPCRRPHRHRARCDGRLLRRAGRRRRHLHHHHPPRVAGDARCAGRDGGHRQLHEDGHRRDGVPALGPLRPGDPGCNRCRHAVRTTSFAARAQGCSVLRIVFSEIFPNLLNALIVVATLEMAQAIILEAALSYLGFGGGAATALVGSDGLGRQGLSPVRSPG